MNKEKIVEIINGSDILKRISNEEVFGFEDYLEDEASIESVFGDGEELILKEHCDHYHWIKLNKKDVIELSKVFSKIAEQM